MQIINFLTELVTDPNPSWLQYLTVNVSYILISIILGLVIYSMIAFAFSMKGKNNALALATISVGFIILAVCMIGNLYIIAFNVMSTIEMYQIGISGFGRIILFSLYIISAISIVVSIVNGTKKFGERYSKE